MCDPIYVKVRNMSNYGVKNWGSLLLAERGDDVKISGVQKCSFPRTVTVCSHSVCLLSLNNNCTKRILMYRKKYLERNISTC